MYSVIGATGKVGGAVVRSLRQRGIPVRAALAGATRVHVILPMNSTASDGLADADSIIRAFGDALVDGCPEHVTAISGYGAHNASGIGLTMIWHRLEERLRALPVATTVLRSAEHMQSWAGALRIAAQGGVVPLFHQPLTKVLPTVSVPDVGMIAADILAGPPGAPGVARIIHVEGPRRYAVSEIVETMAAVIGRPVETRDVPFEEWIPAYTARGLSESYARLVAEMVRANNAGRMDVEPGMTDIRRGSTTLAEAFAALVPGA